MSDPTVRNYSVPICDGCIHGEGEQCHTPGCVCIWLTTREIAKLLDRIQVAPKVDGKVLYTARPI